MIAWVLALAGCSWGPAAPEPLAASVELVHTARQEGELEPCG